MLWTVGAVATVIMALEWASAITVVLLPSVGAVLIWLCRYLVQKDKPYALVSSDVSTYEEARIPVESTKCLLLRPSQ